MSQSFIRFMLQSCKVILLPCDKRRGEIRNKNKYPFVNNESATGIDFWLTFGEIRKNCTQFEKFVKMAKQKQQQKYCNERKKKEHLRNAERIERQTITIRINIAKVQEANRNLLNCFQFTIRYLQKVALN